MSDQRERVVAQCVSTELVSAYVDGLVDERQRDEIQAHLAECEACYELVMEVVRTQEALPIARAESYGAIQPDGLTDQRFSDKPRPVVGQVQQLEREGHSTAGVQTPRRGFLLLAGGSLAAAAAVTLAVRTQSEWWQRLWGSGSDHMVGLVEAIGNERLIEGRLSGGFRYGPLRSPTRSGSSDRLNNLALLAAAGQLQEMLDGRRTPENVHAWGVAEVLLGNYDAGIAALEEALAGSPNAAQIHNDLAAAYLASAQAFERVDDASKALAEADRALQLDPTVIEALFNRGLALEQLGRREEAVIVWRDLIARDRSEWRLEADRRLREGSSPLDPSR